MTNKLAKSDLELVAFDDLLTETLASDQAFSTEYHALREQRELALQLKQARIAKHLTQADIAERTGINVKNISRLERGLVSPTFSTLSRYAKALGGKLTLQF